MVWFPSLRSVYYRICLLEFELLCPIPWIRRRRWRKSDFLQGWIILPKEIFLISLPHTFILILSHTISSHTYFLFLINKIFINIPSLKSQLGIMKLCQIYEKRKYGYDIISTATSSNKKIKTRSFSNSPVPFYIW